MSSEQLLSSIKFLEPMVEAEIARHGETDSFMVRSGLLREILAVARDAIEAKEPSA